MAVGFVLKLNDGETWRDLVRRHSAPEGLDHECLSDFDTRIASGEDEDSAAFCALYEWDCCPIGEVEDDEPLPPPEQ